MRLPTLVEIEAELGRQDFAEFAKMAWPQVESAALLWNWHHDAVCEHLQAVTDGRIRDLLVCLPPGCTKSLLVSTLWPAWEWTQDPTTRYIYSSYKQGLSNKNAKLHRDLVASDWYQARWPDVNISKSESKKISLFENARGGFRFSTSVTGEATGRHGNRLVFDDLVKAQDAEGRAAVDPKAIIKANDFWFKTMATRTSEQGARRVGIMQRLHFEDTAGKCSDRGYTVLSLPMEYDPRNHCRIEETGWEDPRTEPGELLWPERFPREDIEDLKITLGSRGSAAQLQQTPQALTGGLFKPGWMHTWTKIPANARYIMTVDATFKDRKDSDYVAIQVWAVKNPNYYLVDQFTGQWGLTKTMAKILEMKDRHPRVTGTYIEDKANGTPIIQILKDEVSGIVAWEPKGSKESRAEAVSPIFEAGNVFIPDANTASWVPDYVTELSRFPVALHDDQVDATTMALLILHKRSHRKYKDAVRKMRGML